MSEYDDWAAAGYEDERDARNYEAIFCAGICFLLLLVGSFWLGGVVQENEFLKQTIEADGFADHQRRLDSEFQMPNRGLPIKDARPVTWESGGAAIMLSAVVRAEAYGGQIPDHIALEIVLFGDIRETWEIRRVRVMPNGHKELPVTFYPIDDTDYFAKFGISDIESLVSGKDELEIQVIIGPRSRIMAPGEGKGTIEQIARHRLVRAYDLNLAP